MPRRTMDRSGVDGRCQNWCSTRQPSCTRCSRSCTLSCSSSCFSSLSSSSSSFSAASVLRHGGEGAVLDPITAWPLVCSADWQPMVCVFGSAEDLCTDVENSGPEVIRSTYVKFVQDAVPLFDLSVHNVRTEALHSFFRLWLLMAGVMLWLLSGTTEPWPSVALTVTLTIADCCSLHCADCCTDRCTDRCTECHSITAAVDCYTDVLLTVAFTFALALALTAVQADCCTDCCTDHGTDCSIDSHSNCCD